MPDPLLTSTQVAKTFGVSAETVRNWAEAGKLPHLRTPGGQYRFRRADVEAFMAEPTEAAS